MDCQYCYKPVGFMKRKHAACEASFNAGLKLITTEMAEGLLQPTLAKDLSERVQSIATKHYVDAARLKKLGAASWAKALNDSLKDNLPSPAQEKNLTLFSEKFGLSESTLNQEGDAYTKLQQAIVLRGLMNSDLPKNVKLIGQFPVNLQRYEQIVWAFTNVDYLEDKTRQSHGGGIQGSTRIGKGTYYPPASFQGHNVARQNCIHIDFGSVVVTNKNLYFVGGIKNFRLPYRKIVTFLGFDNGFGFVRDSETAKPEIFVTNMGWFGYNLVTNLARMDTEI